MDVRLIGARRTINKISSGSIYGKKFHRPVSNFIRQNDSPSIGTSFPVPIFAPLPLRGRLLRGSPGEEPWRDKNNKSSCVREARRTCIADFSQYRDSIRKWWRERSRGENGRSRNSEKKIYFWRTHEQTCDN